MTKRNPVSGKHNIYFDSEIIDNENLSLEQDYNATVESAIINNHIGSGIIPESLLQNIIFDSTDPSLLADFLDGKAISVQNQPTDINFGNQLEIELSHSLVCGNKTIKLCIIGLDFQSNLQFETFTFKVNEIQLGQKHFTKILVLLFNDFIGDPSLSFNLGGRIVIKEAKPATLSRSTIMVAQDLQPNLFFRDFFTADGSSLQTLLQSALPYYNVDTLGIYTSAVDQKILLNTDIVTQMGQKFVATTNNIQKVTVLLSVRNLAAGSETDLAWTGDLLLSIYPLQSSIECPTDVVPNLAIDFSPYNIPIAQISINYDSLRTSGVILDSVPQPVDFVFSNSPVANGNSITIGNYYAFTLKRSGSANKCDILIDVGSDLISNSRITTFTGTLWVDVPEEDLWFKIFTDASKVSDAMIYEAGYGITIPKTIFDTDTQSTIDYSYNDIQFVGNDVYHGIIQAITEESDPIPDQRTGQPVNSQKEFVPQVQLLNSIDIANLEVASEPLIIGAIADTNKKFFDPSQALISSKIHSATMINDELLIRIITDTTDTGRYDTSVVALETNLLLGDMTDAKIIPDSNYPFTYYRISEAKLCSMMVGDVNGDGIIDQSDLDLLNTYLNFNLNVGSPRDTIITTDGYVDGYTTFVNGYTSLITPFINLFSISFQLIDPITHLIIAAGTDGVLVANPNDDRLAQFTSSTFSFKDVVGLNNYRLIVLSPTVLSNYGGFEIISVDTLTDVISIRKIILNGDVIAQMLRADIDGDFQITAGDGYLLENYIDRVSFVGTLPYTYPAPSTPAYPKIGTQFNVLRMKVQKFIDRDDDYSPVVTGRSTTIHPVQDIFLDGYFANHNFYSSPMAFNIQKQLTWEESLVVTNSRAKLVPSVFTSLSGYTRYPCSLDGIKCNTYPLQLDFDSGTVDLFAPDNIIIGEGELHRPDGAFYKVDFEVGTVVIEIPNGLYGNERTLNIAECFIVSVLDGNTKKPTGLTKLGFPAMKFADCSYVESDALSRDQLRFSVAVQSFSPNTNGISDEGYTGAIVDGKIGVSIDYATGLVTLNFTNLYQDDLFRTLSTKIQISVYLKKGGFNNLPLFVDSNKVHNILKLISVFHEPINPALALIDLERDVTGVLPIIHGGTGLNSTGTYGTVLTSTGSGLSYQFIYDLPGVIAYSRGSIDANRIPKTDINGRLDPSFLYKNPIYIYGSAGAFSHDGYSPIVIGAFPFRWDTFIGQGLHSVNLEVILETTNFLNTATIQLFNVSTCTYLTLSTDTRLTTTNNQSTYLISNNIATQMAEGANDYIYEIHLSLNPTSSIETAICKMSRLVLTYNNPYNVTLPDANSYNFTPNMPPLS
jgi:hypothetical protein